jgi:hypothetical protein
MAQSNTPEEETTKHEMIGAYKAQEHAPNGFNDWGVFTAHVVHAQRTEIQRLHGLLQGRGIDAGQWADPLDR